MLPIRWDDCVLVEPGITQFSDVQFDANFGSFQKGELVHCLTIFGCGPDDFVCVVEARNKEMEVYKSLTFELKVW
jgi:hypothetical protein